MKILIYGVGNGLTNPNYKEKIMKYEEALQLWGAGKLASYAKMMGEDVVLSSVKVEFDFSEGYNCCGGRDPHCYCSFAESPRADVLITGYTTGDNSVSSTIDIASFDFVTVLGELVALGQGAITS